MQQQQMESMYMHEGEANLRSAVCRLMNQGPLAVGVGAGAGGLSSALLTLLLGHVRDTSEQFVCPSPVFRDEPVRADFYLGLAIGVLLGFAIGLLLDLLYLARQHLALRNRLATLSLTRFRCA